VILPDTSLWVEYLRDAPPAPSAGSRTSVVDQLDQMIEHEQVLTCGPVVAELMAGARGRQRDQIAEQLGAQPWIELRRSDWMTVGDAAARLRELGQTTPLVDIQIAVCALKAKAELWTLDHDFERIADALDDLQLRMLEL
jgi:predicted nucleic acid-binding protein